MPATTRAAASPPRASATVVLLRDAPGGMEVFLVRRHHASDVLGGAYVFPGGKLDASDTAASTLDRLAAPRAELHALLGEAGLDTATAAGLYVAACRETFEESGVLLATGAGASQATAARSWQREGLPFDAIVARLCLALDWRNVVPWSRWITPRVPTMFSKRFDARFFVAMVPEGQVAEHDDVEATGSLWVRPHEALQQFRDGALPLAPAQLMSLAALARHTDVADVFAAARGRRPPVIEPEPFTLEDLSAIAFPGDRRHPVAERALPGPSFLVYRNGRFEPFGEFAELLA